MKGLVAITIHQIEQSVISIGDMFAVIAEGQGAPRGLSYYATKVYDDIMYYKWDSDVSGLSRSHFQLLEDDGWKIIGLWRLNTANYAT